MNDDLSLIYGRYFEQVSQAFSEVKDNFKDSDSTNSSGSSDLPSEVSNFFENLIAYYQWQKDVKNYPDEEEYYEDEEEPFYDGEEDDDDGGEDTEPAYVPQVAKLQFITAPSSDPIGDEYRARQKFVNMYMYSLKMIAGDGLEGLGKGFSLGGRGGFQWDSTIAVQTQEQEDRVIDLAQEASSDWDFEIAGERVKVRVSFSPAVLEPEPILPEPELILPEPEPILPEPELILPEPELILPEPEPEPERLICPQDMFECPDGSFVGRDEFCNFRPCPQFEEPEPTTDEVAGVFMTTVYGPGPTFLARTGIVNGKPSYEGPGGLKVEFYDAGMGGQWFYYGGGPEDAEHANSEPGNEPYPWLASWRYGATATRQELFPVDPYAGVPPRPLFAPISIILEIVAKDKSVGNSPTSFQSLLYRNPQFSQILEYMKKLPIKKFGNNAFNGNINYWMDFDPDLESFVYTIARMINQYPDFPYTAFISYISDPDPEDKYVPKVAKLEFINPVPTSDPVGDEYRAKQKFIYMYMNPLTEIAGDFLEGLGFGFSLGGRGGFQWTSTVILETPEQENRLFDLVRQASTDPEFGLKVVVSFLPASNEPHPMQGRSISF
jgi:hypothetical protein